MRAWVADLNAKGLAPATVQKAYQILGAAVDGGLIAISPCHKVPLPKIEAEEMRFLTPEEIGRLAHVIDPRYRAFVLLKAYGGLRLSEMAGLRRGRVDLLRRSVRVAEQAVEVRGHMYFGPPKTKAGRRTVPLPRQVADELASHLERFVGRTQDELVFPGTEWRRAAGGGMVPAGLASGDHRRSTRSPSAARSPTHGGEPVGRRRREPQRGRRARRPHVGVGRPLHTARPPAICSCNG